MTPSTIFLIGVFTVVLLAIFTYETIHQLRKAGEAPPRTAARAESAAARMLEHVPPLPHPMRLMVATDGSPCSALAVRRVAQRPWPPDTEVEVVTVVHTKLPQLPDVTLVGSSVYADALDQDRQEAPGRVQAAERLLRDVPGLTVRSAVLEGDPGKSLVEEAERSKADLVIVGSHGYGSVKRLVLGSVSQHVAAHAPCSVEIVRCPHGQV
jgi:nucleotide-binding universal stress UspA family protein